MKNILFAVVLAQALVTAASAATIPAGWITVKDPEGVCKAGAPADFKPFQGVPSLVQGPGDMIELQVSSQAGKKVEPLLPAVQKAVGVDKMFENTANRVFYSTGAKKGFDGKVLTGWYLTVNGTGGTCYAQITLQPGASEELAKKIAETLGPAK